MAAVDVEDESILASIFKDTFPDSWRDNPDFAAYLSELSSFGVEKLNREPERLAEERAQILQQTRELAFSNYQTFIRTAECTELIYRDFGRVESSVSRLLDKLPGFGERCRGFMKEAEEIGASRRMNSLTLNRHTEILEILEIPQLMDTCVRNGYYEEALELAAYVKRLEKKHTSLPVIQGIVSEVRQSTQLMLNQLLQQLRSNSQLPVCLRVIGYLRRMDAFTEAELRVKFLQARSTWLHSILAAIPEDDPYFHITKTIEACRVHLFDIITQYRAIFSDDDPLVPPADGQVWVNEAAIFHGWVVQKVAEFLETLETDLERGVGGRLDSLLGQCMYFGLSFSRVGADFRGQLAPMFQRVAAQTFSRAVQEAADKFQEDMNMYTLITLPSVLGGTVPPAAPTSQPGTLQPPMSLLDFQPLACFLNNILTAFNDLRLCCPCRVGSGRYHMPGGRPQQGDPPDNSILPSRRVGLQRQRKGAVLPLLLIICRRSAAVPPPLPASSVSPSSARSGSWCPSHPAAQVQQSGRHRRGSDPGTAQLPAPPARDVASRAGCYCWIGWSEGGNASPRARDGS
ncbi:hypothetical protein fugu_002840 [Takifugu bimaculatus]|uniref:Conserved oligomeric Golgi complex subunit 8 n=1 Tax=Takifugu bimaculatus TaxID=433685 RepID=A0A4Z2BDP7_9TELE|nr:hypothetical protein fugu_002840 [Takifugu bimaculatus]